MEPTAFEVGDTSRLELRAEVEELDAGRITLGLPVAITPQGGGPAVGHGRVVRVAPRLEPWSLVAEDRPPRTVV